MSNESERIDLTQFEGHTEGNWCISDDGNGLIKTDEFWIRLFEPYCDDGITEDEDTINKELMVSAPDLIAELKRCYEEIDALRSIAPSWVKIETFTDDGKDLFVDMEDSDGNCFSGYINRAYK